MSESGLGEQGDRARVTLVVRHDGLREDLVRALEASGYLVDAQSGPMPLFSASGGGLEKSINEPRRRPDAHVRILDLEAFEDSPSFDPAGFACAEKNIWLASASGGGQPLPGLVITKPFSIHVLEQAIRDCLSGAELPAELRHDPVLRTCEPALLAELGRARRLAREEVPVVIEGELGTGRRALARAMHRLSPRGREVCRVVDRAEVEVAGASGIAQQIEEAFSACASGTLIVVEPAEWIDEAQRALCEALRSVESRPRCFSVARCALPESTRDGKLRLELQYHLEGSSVSLLPFRERELDQAELCTGIARRIARSLGRETPAMDGTLVADLAAAGFPGNRIGLESHLRSAMLTTDGLGGMLSVRPASQERERAAAEASSLDLKSLERDTIVRALAHWQGNRTRASESLGISVRTLRNKIRDYGLR